MTIESFFLTISQTNITGIEALTTGLILAILAGIADLRIKVAKLCQWKDSMEQKGY